MMQQPKILQVIPTLHSGGAERTVLDIAGAIIARGWTSVVASAGGRLQEQLTSCGSQHISLPLNSKNPVTIWQNAARLTRVINEQGIDLIHARSRAPAWSALLAAKRTGIPFVTTYHGSYNQKSKLKAFYNSIMARSDVVIANSNWTAKLIASRNPWASDRIKVVHRGIDFDAFNRQAVSVERIEKMRTDWQVGDDDCVVLLLARLSTLKGQSVVVEAAKQIVPHYPNLKFVLAGETSGRAEFLTELQEKIDKAGLHEQFILPGHCADAAAAIVIADIVLQTSIQAEAFGRVVVEAGALERPVIVSRIGAVYETILAEPEFKPDERTGWMVNPGDADDLAKALNDCLSLGRQERIAIGRRGRVHGQRNFTLEQMCNKTMAIYQGLLE